MRSQREVARDQDLRRDREYAPQQEQSRRQFELDLFNAEGQRQTILQQIGANASLAVKFALEAVNKGLEGTLDEGLLIEASLFALCAATEDKKEGTFAFLAKRTPNFQGR